MPNNDDVARKLRQLSKDIKKAMERALYQFGQIEMAEMKRRTPVDTGTLRDSGQVDRPEWKADSLVLEMGFGGAAEDYAVIVHEDLDAFHPVGQAKFMESVLNESEPHFADRIATAMRADLGWGD